MNSTNAQIYMCKSKDCLRGGEDWTSAIERQALLGYGDYLYRVESFSVDGAPSMVFPPLLVLGLYTYKPNMTI